MASRNGLNAKIRGLKGVGFARSLPSAFGFDNGIQPDGSNDYMIVQPILGKSVPTALTMEWWTYNDTSYQGYIFSIYDSVNNLSVNGNIDGPGRHHRFDTSAGVGISVPWDSVDDNKRTHMLLAVDTTKDRFDIYSDGLLVYQGVAGSPGDINRAIPKLFSKCEFFRYAPFGSIYSNLLMDEFRLYSTALRDDQVITNYNNRMGNNPCETEHLLIWHKFEKFETLDFSPLQDGSDMRLGIRDMSGKNNHSQPFNMDTNPASPTYVIKPF